VTVETAKLAVIFVAEDVNWCSPRFARRLSMIKSSSGWCTLGLARSDIGDELLSIIMKSFLLTSNKSFFIELFIKSLVNK